MDADNREQHRVLITGAGGALARQTINRLREDHHIVAVDFRKEYDFGSEIPSYHVDFTKRGFEDVFRNHNIQGIIHLGRIGIDPSNRYSRYNANVIGTQKLLDMALKYQAKQVLVLSTYYVYGAHALNPALLDENTPKKASEITQNLVDTVELDNLTLIYLWKYPELSITLLRPCNIVGPGVKNSMAQLLSMKRSPALMGYSPMMQFIHIDDMADAIALSYRENKPGIYNVAPEDWIAYKHALIECGCRPVPIPSVPPAVPATLSRVLGMTAFPSYLINYFKYPVILDGKLFKRSFGFTPQKSLSDIFEYYKGLKRKKKTEKGVSLLD